MNGVNVPLLLLLFCCFEEDGVAIDVLLLFPCWCLLFGVVGVATVFLFVVVRTGAAFVR